MTPRTLALTLKHQALVKSVPDGESVAPAVTASLGEFIELCRELEETNAALNKEAQIVTDDLHNSELRRKSAMRENAELLAALIDAQEELRLIRMKDSPACYDPTLRPHIACIINRAKSKS